jgi:predicted PurR-regulated permease PerM
MPTDKPISLYRSLAKAIFLAAGVFITLWFLAKVVNAILLLLFAIVLALILNQPVSWLEHKNIKRGWAAMIVFGMILLTIAILAWFIGPKINEQFSALIRDLPGYTNDLFKTVGGWFSSYPGVQNEIITGSNDVTQWMPSVPETLVHVGNFSLSLLGSVLIVILFFSMVVYAVTNPRPLVELYLSFFAPGERGKASAALMKISVMLVGWIRANLIGGSIEAVLVTAFLSFMNVPGAWVWGALTLFAELIPRIGFYIMSIPPVLVALSVNPSTAIWVAVFFLVMNEVMGSFVMPRLRSSTMNLHPVSTLFILLAMSSAFGLTGALLAMPMVAIIKAYYEEFYLSRFKEDKLMDEHIDSIIYQKKKN